jgi:hypothetical protein
LRLARDAASRASASNSRFLTRLLQRTDRYPRQ